MKYRLNNNIEVFLDKNAVDALIIKRGTGEILEVEIDSFGRSIFEKLKKDNTICKDNLTEQEKVAFNFLEEFDLVTKEKLPDNLNPFRSQSQAYLDMGLESKKVFSDLEQLTVAVIGVGGTGSWVSLQLLGLGFKRLILIDPDVVEVSNLTRQYFFKHQLGSSKVEALKQNLESQFENTEIETKKQFINSEKDLDKNIQKADIVMIAADIPNRDGAATLIGNWCLKNNKPHIVCGGYSGHGSSLGMTIVPKVTPCWNCYKESIKDKIPKLATDENLFLKGHVNTSGLITSVQIGASFSAMEAFNLAIGRKPSLSGKYSDLMISDVEIHSTEVKKDKNCNWCNT